MNFSASAPCDPFLISEMASESFAYISSKGVTRPLRASSKPFCILTILCTFLDIGKDHRGWAGATFQHVIVALLEFRIEALFRPFGGAFGSLGYFHVKGNTLLQNNLFIEHVDGAGNGYAEGFQDVFGLFLNIRLYASV